jgi:hypothetical protein
VSLAEDISGALGSWPIPSDRSGAVVVPTHCLYPSNSVVSVYVSGGASEFKVTDGGGALKEFLSGGGQTYEDIAVLKSAARPMGLLVSDAGIIHSPMLNLEQVLGAIILVANASKEAALTLVSRFTPAPKKNFREMLAKLIDGERVQGRFTDVSKHRVIVGASTKSHKIDYEISFAGQRRLLVDTVVPEASSINAVLAANLDIKQAELPDTVQRIVYDDEEDWKSADLALLNLGATVIPFTKIRPILNRLAG